MSVETERCIDDLGSIIKRKRVSIGMTREELAYRMNISVSTLKRHENGETGILATTLFEYMDILNLTYEEVVSALHKKRRNLVPKLTYTSESAKARKEERMKSIAESLSDDMLDHYLAIGEGLIIAQNNI